MLRFISNWPDAEPGTIQWCDCEQGKRREEYYWWNRHRKMAREIEKTFHKAEIPPRFKGKTLDTHPGGKGKKRGLAAARAYMRDGYITLTKSNNKENSQRGKYNSILFYGPVGTGKTGLVMPILQDWLDRGELAIYQEYYEFMGNLQSHYGNGESWMRYMELAQQVDLLVLDDLGKVGNGVETTDKKEKLFLLINYRHSHMLPTLMTSNLNPGEMTLFFEERIVSRILEMAAAIKVNGASLREKGA